MSPIAMQEPEAQAHGEGGSRCAALRRSAPRSVRRYRQRVRGWRDARTRSSRGAMGKPRDAWPNSCKGVSGHAPEGLKSKSAAGRLPDPVSRHTF